MRCMYWRKYCKNTSGEISLTHRIDYCSQLLRVEGRLSEMVCQIYALPVSAADAQALFQLDISGSPDMFLGFETKLIDISLRNGNQRDERIASQLVYLSNDILYIVNSFKQCIESKSGWKKICTKPTTEIIKDDGFHIALKVSTRTKKIVLAHCISWMELGRSNKVDFNWKVIIFCPGRRAVFLEDVSWRFTTIYFWTCDEELCKYMKKYHDGCITWKGRAKTIDIPLSDFKRYLSEKPKSCKRALAFKHISPMFSSKCRNYRKILVYKNCKNWDMMCQRSKIV